MTPLASAPSPWSPALAQKPQAVWELSSLWGVVQRRMLNPPQARKLVFTTVDRAVSYYETNRGSFDLSGRVYASGGMGVPQSLTMVSNEAGGRKDWGAPPGWEQGKMTKVWV